MKAILFTALAASAILLASPALADNQGQDQTPLPPAAAPAPAAAPTTPTATPTPGPVLSTGGNVSGSSPGSSCSSRVLVRNAPPTQSPANAWNTNGDVGWPFGFAGQVPMTVPTTAPSVGCSR